MAYNIASISSHFDRAAASYNRVAVLQQRHLAAMLAHLVRDIAPQAKVADIGCGTGMFAKLVGKHKLGWHMTGLDMAGGMCRQASEFQAQTLQGDMHAIPMGDACADLTMCSFVLQWSNDPATAIAEIARITKPGGTIALLTFLDGTLGELSRVCEEIGAAAKTNRFHTANDYEHWCAECGLVRVEKTITRETSYYPTVADLFTTLKDMGATNSQASSMKGLGNRRELNAIREAYTQQYSGPKGVAASWEVGTWIYKK